MTRQENISKWVFIGGAPRSGTSLLQAIFNQHSLCASPPESHIKESFVYAATTQRRKALKDKSLLLSLLKNDKWIPRLGINAEEILNDLPEEISGVELFKIYMERYAAAEGKSILVEGAPFNIWFIKKLHEDFPGCFILHIVRDPRDVVMSTVKANYNSGIDFPLENISSQFMESYMQGPVFGEKYYGRNYIKIYYEDLVRSPEETIRDMCFRLQIHFEPDMLYFQASSSKVAAAEENWKANLSKPFIKDNFNKWKTEMSREDIIKVEYICREFFEMEKDHYTLSDFSRDSWMNVNKALLPLYIKRLKKKVRNVMEGSRTEAQLDQLPPHERLRAKGMLRAD